MTVGPDDVLIVIDGARSTLMTLDINNSYGIPPAAGDLPGVNRALAALTVAVSTAIAPERIPLGRDVHVIGYSAGGVIGAVLAAGLHRLRPDLRFYVNAFNPPRGCWRSFCQNAGHFQFVRSHSKYDPVGQLPLHSGESPYADYLTSAEFLRNANQYDQIGAGFQFTDVGGIEQLAPFWTPAAPTNSALSIVGWATGFDDGSVVAHSIQELHRRINSYVSVNEDFSPELSYVDGTSPANTPTPIIDPPVFGTHGSDGAIDQMQLALGALPANVRGTDLGSGRLLDRPYYRQRWSGKWFVMYRGTPLFQETSKASAGRRANGLNKVVEDFRTSPIKDQDDLVNSVNLETL
jgi:hypothetical protein